MWPTQSHFLSHTSDSPMYINRTFHLALPNLAINGLEVPPAQFLPPLRSSSAPANDPSSGLKYLNGGSNSQQASEPVVVFEPFDNRKRVRVEDLCREEEDLLRDIALLKHKIPTTAASRFSGSATEGLKLDDKALDSYLSNIIQAATSSVSHNAGGSESASQNGGPKATGKAGPTVDVKPLPRQDDTEQTFGDAVNGLSRLTKVMPATVAKMDRARLAGETKTPPTHADGMAISRQARFDARRQRKWIQREQSRRLGVLKGRWILDSEWRQIGR
ncbi:hypothetical protein MKZ38_009711 [Zalerion maritima]|uniref:Uncharacterized protein n=1 Tax=Zalerion maritima TaxID=339359 RepID=A0AAD5RGD8_9PEZI|nr:hypothetical protein MKZ38_009711 [Zalerion maritima]